MVRFGNCHRQPIPLPRLAQTMHRPRQSGRQLDTHCLYVRICRQCIVAMVEFGETLQALVKETLARQIMIDTDNIWRTRRFDKECQLMLANSCVKEMSIPRMLRLDTPAQQVETEPPTFIFIVSLLLQFGCTEYLAEIFGLHQFGRWRNPPYSLHCQHHCAALRI